MTTCELALPAAVTKHEAAVGADESVRTVARALAVNAAMAVVKAAGGLMCHSPAVLSEAAHSAVDCSTELILLAGLRHARRPADDRHQFGYGKAYFFWALLAAVAMFTSGAMFALYEGVQALEGHGGGEGSLWLAVGALALSAVADGASGAGAVRQLWAERGDRTFWAHVRLTTDTAVKAVLLEDAADVSGVLLAGTGLGFRVLTGSHVYEGVASLAIGVLLAGMAFQLGRVNMRLLIGQSADVGLVEDVRGWLAGTVGVDGVAEVWSMQLGARSVLV